MQVFTSKYQSSVITAYRSVGQSVGRHSSNASFRWYNMTPVRLGAGYLCLITPQKFKRRYLDKPNSYLKEEKIGKALIDIFLYN